MKIDKPSIFRYYGHKGKNCLRKKMTFLWKEPFAMNPEPKKYQPAQIVKELMREFRINANEHNKDSLRKKVEDVCRNTTVNIRDENQPMGQKRT